MTTAFLTAVPTRVIQDAPPATGDAGLQRFAHETCATAVEIGRLDDAALGVISADGHEIQVLADWGGTGLSRCFAHGRGARLIREAAESRGLVESADGTLVAIAAPAGGATVVMLGHCRHERTGELSQVLAGIIRVAALSLCERLRLIEAERRQSAKHHARLTCAVHDEVVQRLFGVSLILDAQETLEADLRAICATEIERALSDLRVIISSPVGPRAADAASPGNELRMTLEAIREQGAEVNADLDEVAIAPAQQAVVCSIVNEALRNARKHAEPERVQITVRQAGEVLLVSVFNDGVRAKRSGRRSQRGVGLQLAATEAALGGGVLDSGPAGSHGWAVRLVLPLEERDDCQHCAGAGTGGGSRG